MILPITFGPNGNLYAGFLGNRLIEQFNPTTGASLGVFAEDLPNGILSYAIEFGPDGYLYTANIAQAPLGIYRYDGITGAAQGLFTSGVSLSSPYQFLFVPGESNRDLILNANVTANSGGIELSASDDILQNSGTVSTTGNGEINYYAGTTSTDGIITMATGTQAISTGGNITLNADGNITLGAISTAGNVSLTSGATGGIVSGNATTDVIASGLSIVAGLEGIGNFSNPLTMNVTTLTTNTTYDGNYGFQHLRSRLPHHWFRRSECWQYRH